MDITTSYWGGLEQVLYQHVPFTFRSVDFDHTDMLLQPPTVAYNSFNANTSANTECNPNAHANTHAVPHSVRWRRVPDEWTCRGRRSNGFSKRHVNLMKAPPSCRLDNFDNFCDQP